MARAKTAVLSPELLFALACLGACNGPPTDIEAVSAGYDQDCTAGDVDSVPIDNGKFIAYGGRDWNVSTEVIGTYKGGTFDSLFIEPISSPLDNAYWHLLMPGNSIIPTSTPDWDVWFTQTQGTRDIIKMELYHVGPWEEPPHPEALPVVEDPITH